MRNDFLSTILDDEDLLSNPQEKLEDIKNKLASFIIENYDLLTDTDTMDDIRDAYDTIKYIIKKLSTYEPEVFYGYKLI